MGRRPLPLERMLRIYLLQQWFNLSDPAMEEMLIDSESMRRFAGINLMDDPVPDETTILKFRHLLEKHQLTERLFREVGMLLTERGLLVLSRPGHHRLCGESLGNRRRLTASIDSIDSIDSMNTSLTLGCPRSSHSGGTE